MKKIVVSTAILTTFIFSAETNSTKIGEDYYKVYINVSNALDKKSIAKEIGVKKSDFFNFWSDKLVIKKEFTKDIKSTIKGYLESIGYFDAKVDIKKSDSEIYITIKEGEPIKVIDIKINTNFNIKNIVSWRKGEIFKSSKFDDIKKEIKEKLLESGYCNAKVDTKAYVDLKSYSAKLKYNINKRDLCYFGKTKIYKKPEDIKKDVIFSRIKYREGDKFDIRKIKDSYNSLNSLNIFANIQIKYDLDKKTRYVDSNISLDKAEKLRRYLYAIGVDSEVGVRVRGMWESRNFFGNAKRVRVKAKLSKNQQDISSELFIPAIFNYKKEYADLYVSSGFLLEKSSSYREKKGYINSYLEYNHNDFSFKLGLGLERLIIKLRGDYPSKIGGTFNILYPYASITYDGRDSKLDPKNGYYFKAYGEYGLSYRSNGVEYFKYQLEGRAIKSFGDLTLSAVGKIGAIHEKSQHLPASKLFYGGGLFSNRAYGKDKIGYVVSNKSFSAMGGKSFLNLQLEANYKIYKKFYGAIFFDSTMISKDEFNFKGKRLDTLGVGLRYKTPIGPIKIDLGYNIHNRKDYAISIMLGQSF